MKTFLIVMVVLVSFSQNVFAQRGFASWYSVEACKYNHDPKCPTASGESLYDLIESKTPYAANWGFDFGTSLRVTGIDTGRSTIVVTKDRGPAKRLKERIIDLNPESFKEICGSLRNGLCEVEVEVVND